MRVNSNVSPQMVTLAVTSGAYVSFAHKLLWDSSQRHISIAAERPQDSWMLHLSAGLLAAAAFEAYLNYVGGEILPHVWKDERKNFSAEPYRGTMGKLKRIAEELRTTLPPKSRRPLAGVVELQDLCDKIVHASPKKAIYRSVHKQDQFPRLPSMWLYREAPPERVRRHIADVQSFAEQLHTVIRTSEFRFVVVDSHPFLGALSFGTGSVESAG